jgi:hypothetical protein
VQPAGGIVFEARATAPAAHEVPLRVKGLPWLRGRHAGDHRSQVGSGALPASSLPSLHLLCYLHPWPSAITPADLGNTASGDWTAFTHRAYQPSHVFCNVCSNFEDTEDASLDPEPIMVTEAEQDAALSAILDQNIGIGANGWDPKLERR